MKLNELIGKKVIRICQAEFTNDYEYTKFSLMDYYISKGTNENNLPIIYNSSKNKDEILSKNFNDNNWISVDDIYNEYHNKLKYFLYNNILEYMTVSLDAKKDIENRLLLKATNEGTKSFIKGKLNLIDCVKYDLTKIIKSYDNYRYSYIQKSDKNEEK